MVFAGCIEHTHLAHGMDAVPCGAPPVAELARKRDIAKLEPVRFRLQSQKLLGSQELTECGPLVFRDQCHFGLARTYVRDRCCPHGPQRHVERLFVRHALFLVSRVPGLKHLQHSGCANQGGRPQHVRPAGLGLAELDLAFAAAVEVPRKERVRYGSPQEVAAQDLFDFGGAGYFSLPFGLS